MSEIEPGGAPPFTNPSQEIRYDLAGNPLPPQPRQYPESINSNSGYDQSPLQGGYAGPPTGGYAPPPAQPYGPPTGGYAPPPAPPYGPPPGGYPAPPSPYGVPPGGYAAPPPPYSQAPAGYNAAASGYGPPTPAAQGGSAYGTVGARAYPQYPAAGPTGQPFGAAQPQNKVGWYVAIAVAFVFVIALIIMSRSGQTVQVAVPTDYVSVNSPDKSFSCQGPANWETIGSGSEGSDKGGFLFKQGPVRIDITSDQSLSYWGDIAKSPGTTTDDPNSQDGAPPPPVATIHEMTRKSVSEKFSGYSELDAEPLQCAFGDARISEFSADGTFGGRVHGYRVTMLGTQKAIRVECECPQDNWDLMKPVFLKVVGSIAPGSG